MDGAMHACIGNACSLKESQFSHVSELVLLESLAERLCVREHAREGWESTECGRLTQDGAGKECHWLRLTCDGVT
jgi:hypothetical protein